MDEGALVEKAARVAELARKADVRIVIAESMTGGALSALLTENSGASEAFSYALITYSNEAKQYLLNVAPELLLEKGAVSEQVAKSMLQGILAHAKTIVSKHSNQNLKALGLAITGYAGPKAKTQAQVGTIFLALGFLGGSIRVEKYQIKALGRKETRRKATEICLQILEYTLKEKTNTPDNTS